MEGKETTIGDRLRKIRIHFKLKQSEFADSLGLKQSYYSTLERGEKKVTSKVITQLVEKFGVNSDWLINGNDEMLILDNDSRIRARTREERRNELIYLENSYNDLVSSAQKLMELSKKYTGIEYSNTVLNEYKILEKRIIEFRSQNKYATIIDKEYTEYHNQLTQGKDKIGDQIAAMIDRLHFNTFKNS